MSFLPGRLIVMFKKGVTPQEANDLITGENLQVINRLGIDVPLMPLIYLVNVPDETEEKWHEKLSSSPLVQSVGVDHTIYPA